MPRDTETQSYKSWSNLTKSHPFQIILVLTSEGKNLVNIFGLKSLNQALNFDIIQFLGSERFFCYLWMAYLLFN